MLNDIFGTTNSKIVCKSADGRMSVHGANVCCPMCKGKRVPQPLHPTPRLGPAPIPTALKMA